MTQQPTIKAKELCSRKLWQIVSAEDAGHHPDLLQAALRELEVRRHYLTELVQLGKLERQLDID